MRYLTRALIVLAALPAPAAIYAQEKPAESVDDYLCIFAGKCGEESGTAAAVEATPTRDAPGLKGFCLACTDKKAAATASRPVAGTPTKKVAASAAPPRPQQASAAPPRQAYASNSSRPAASSGQAQRTSADLRLTFEYNSATLTAAARERARKFAEALQRPELADRRFAIEGHTDAAGGRAYNLDLSERRAEAVADFLVGQGVSRDRLETHGYGPDRPLSGVSAVSEQNRRVEAVLVS